MEKSSQGSIINIDSIGCLTSDEADGGDSAYSEGYFFQPAFRGIRPFLKEFA